jgi:integrase
VGYLSNKCHGFTPPYVSHLLRHIHQAELEAQEQAAAEKAEQGTTQITFDSFWDEHYYPHCQATKTQRTYKAEYGRYLNWIKPFVGHKPLQGITANDIATIRDKAQAKGRKPQTITHTRNIIRQVFNHAIMLKMFTGIVPTKGVQMPKINGQRSRYLTRHEAETLIKELYQRSQQLGDYSMLSLYTGMRAGELFALTWSCIDFSAQTIAIKDPKNGNSRHAYMTGQVKEMLKRRQSEANTPKPSTLVFPSRNGKRIPEVSYSFNRAVNHLKLNEGVTDPRDRVVFHTLRHTFASWLAMAGTPMRTLQDLLGHRTPSMTQRYAHLSPDHKRQAVKALEGVGD